MVGLNDEALAVRFAELAASKTATYGRWSRRSVRACFEGGYFLYRFLRETFIVAKCERQGGRPAPCSTARRRAICRAAARVHLTRSLMDSVGAGAGVADL